MIWWFMFWTVFGVLAFAFALAVQARIIIGVILARALRARDKALPIRDSRLAVVKAGNGETGIPEVDHIMATWPAQIRQLKTARKICMIAPVLILAWIAYGRLAGRF